MAVTEQSRNRLQQHLKKTLGTEDATALMEILDDRATKQDVENVRQDVENVRQDVENVRQDVENVRQDVENLRQSTLVEFADLRTELRTGLAEGKAGLAGVRAEMADLRTEVRTEIADLRTELRTGLAEGKTGLAGVRTEIANVRADFSKALLRNTLVLVGTNVTLFGLALFKLG